MDVGLSVVNEAGCQSHLTKFQRKTADTDGSAENPTGNEHLLQTLV